MTRICSLLVLALACSDEKGAGDDDPGGGDDTADTGDSGSEAPCPDDVPEEYRYLWDCGAASCDGGSMAYHHGVGSSDGEGGFAVTEEWFVFESRDDYCVETFELSGEWSDYDPSTFKCSGCEEIYDIRWEMTSDNACALKWGKIFIEDKNDDDGPFNGYIMFDTHTELTDERNEDNAILVVTAMLGKQVYYLDINYARGEAWPTTSVDGPPEDYTWSSTGACWRAE